MKNSKCIAVKSIDKLLSDKTKGFTTTSDDMNLTHR